MLRTCAHAAFMILNSLTLVFLILTLVVDHGVDSGEVQISTVHQNQLGAYHKSHHKKENYVILRRFQAFRKIKLGKISGSNVLGTDPTIGLSYFWKFTPRMTLFNNI